MWLAPLMGIKNCFYVLKIIQIAENSDYSVGDLAHIEGHRNNSWNVFHTEIVVKEEFCMGFRKLPQEKSANLPAFFH